MSAYWSILIGAVLVNNFVLSQTLGICPFLGVSKRLGTALGMSGAVVFVMALASLATGAVYKLVLIPHGLQYMQTIVFILVIAGLVQVVEVIMLRFAPPLYKALGIYLPLITTNCAVLGAAVINAKKFDDVTQGYSLLKATVYGTASGVGFALALLLFASIRERLDLAHPPAAMKGTALALVTAGLLAMAFMGFAGLG
ncbi:MAG: RnfABCDGE type electron transport complex subunit A [Lentisphaeria bacterium]|jgi:electron transport complex protein RnfA